MKKLIYIFCLVLAMSFETAYSQIELETVVISPHKKQDGVKPENTVTTENTPATEEMLLRYYYFPNLSAYFDLKLTKYIYQVNGEWVMKDNIPPNYRGYSIYNNYRVQIPEYFGDKPYELLSEHRKMYPADYTGRLQKIALMKKEAEKKSLSYNENSK